MAHAICAAEVERRSLPVQVLSAGVSDFIDTCPAEAAWLTCLQYGTPIPRFEAMFAANLDFSDAVRVFIMEPFYRDALTALQPNLFAPVTLLGEHDPWKRGATIEDPMNQGIPAFERCYSRLRDCIISYLDTTDDFNRSA